MVTHSSITADLQQSLTFEENRHSSSSALRYTGKILTYLLLVVMDTRCKACLHLKFSYLVCTIFISLRVQILIFL